jgi:RNA 2',3'-cyclic 3'-phosphodiesterase
MRAFVAIDITSADVLDGLVAFQGELAKTGAELKPVERENIHFTVKFLGDISDSQAAEADSRLKKLRLSGGRIGVEGVGVFPSLSHPSVIWAGVAKEGREAMVAAAEAAIAALAGIGEDDRRGFQPHATMARVRSGRNRASLVDLVTRSSALEFGPMDLDSVKLKSSTLTPSGPVYRDVGVYPLA